MYKSLSWHMEGMETRFSDPKSAEMSLTMEKLLKSLPWLFTWSLSLAISAIAAVISAELLKAMLTRTLPSYTGP